MPALRTLNDRFCEGCGREFRPRSSDQRFCSRACWYAAPGKKLLEGRPCSSCQQSFEPRWSSQRYCSPKCAHDAKRTSLTTRACENCGTLFETRRERQRFCSRACGRTAQGNKSAALGTTRVANTGYIEIKVGTEYLGANRGGWMLEHRYVMEQVAERKLRPGETVHHKNGDRADNRPENLELFAGRHPRGQRDAHCPTCTCFT